MALDVGDETVKGEIVHIKVKNDLAACEGVVLNFAGAAGKFSGNFRWRRRATAAKTPSLQRWWFGLKGCLHSLATQESRSESSLLV